MTCDIVPLIAWHLDSPTELFLFSGYRGRVFDDVQRLNRKNRKNKKNRKIEIGSTSRFEADIEDCRWENVCKMQPRIDAANIDLGYGRFLLAGGIDDHVLRQGGKLDTVQVFDSLTNTWHAAPSLLKKRQGCCGALLDGYIYVLGHTGMERLGIEHVERALERGHPGSSLSSSSLEASWEKIEATPRYRYGIFGAAA